MYRELPKIDRHCNSLFPNNYLDFVELKNEEKLKKLNKKLLEIIENDKSKELTILNYIKDKKAYHIIGSILKGYNFGHHEAYLFREFQLGVDYRVDYLLVGKSSDGYHMILIELEGSNGKITLKGGEYGKVIRGGINQVKDWRRWIEGSYSTMTESFKKETKKQLDDESYKLDTSRINLCSNSRKKR